MSTPLPVLNVAGFVVGQTGSIDLTNTAPSSNPAWINQNATIVFYNESAVGFRFNGRDTGVSFDLPAGAWDPVPIPVGEGALNYQVLYVLANPLVSELIATYYAPNEQVPSLASLGNSPIGGTALTTSTGFANDGNPPGTQVGETSLAGPHTTFLLLNDGTLTVSPETNATFGDPALQVIPGGGVGVYAVVKMDNGAIATDGLGDLTITASGAFFYWKALLSGTDRVPLRIFPTDVGEKDWRLAYSALNHAPYLADATDSTIPWLALPDGSILLGNQNAKFDASGNLGAGNDTLIHGIQESGSFLVQAQAPSATTFSYWVRFRKEMTNIPSSITLSGASSSGVFSSANVSTISTDGFRLNIATSGSGLYLYSVSWVTVGN